MTYCDPILYRLLLALLLGAFAASSHSAEDVCSSPPVTSCNECLSRGPQCAWCFQETFLNTVSVSERCDLAVNLEKKGCEMEFIERPGVKVEVNTTLPNTQVAPQDLLVQLPTGGEVSFVVEVKQLERYPVDLYYLVDVSASMQENLDRLKTVGMALYHRMRDYSSDFRVGFGSFVDKPASPYINVHPSKIENPCNDYGIQCRPAHGFIHVLPMTDNMTEFTRVIQQQRISGNMDTPEGGFDAMLQAAVCQGNIGWRPEAKHLLLLMTDQPSHLALDSRLAGIVVPHDGNCHLENNVYAKTTSMEYPSIGQLAEKLLDNSIHSIFAVEQGQYKWYEDLIPLLPGAYLGQLQKKASNLKDLVIEAYKKLLSVVELEVAVHDQQVHRFQVNVTALCPKGSQATGINKCSNVKPNQTVFFNITISMKDCPSEEEVLILVKPVGFNETTTVRVRPTCSCRCQVAGRCLDEQDETSCGAGEEQDDLSLFSDCKLGGTGPDCSGRGLCVCGKCVCDHTNLGMVHGNYCEVDDFSCPYRHGLLCGGRGQCISGECRCESGWAGESCDCPSSPEPCLSDDGQLCSGRGKCLCGRCHCNDPRHSGQFCEKCPTCDYSCQSHWKCVDCHLSNGLSEGKAKECNRTCSPLVDYVDGIPDVMSESVKQCLYPSSDMCHYKFQMNSVFDSAQIWISRYPECLSSQQYYPTFIGVLLLTVLLGLLILIMVKLLLMRRILAFREPPVYDMANKDSKYVPTHGEKTITYRRDEPLEMHIHVHKIPLNEVWQ
ncbi:integrin beta-8 isoform X1 [Arapaima gigas]